MIPRGGKLASDGRTLVVIGAALGSGRWLAEHVLSAESWRRVYLIDSDRSRTSVQGLEWSFSVPPIFGRSSEGVAGVGFIHEPTRQDPTFVPLEVLGKEVVVCFAVPPGALPDVAAAFLKLVPAPTEVMVSVAGVAASVAMLHRAGIPESRITGVHALNDSSVPSAYGQTIYLAHSTREPPPWLLALIESVGGVSKVGTATEHDRVMSVVQALTHRVLIGFADAVSASGLNLEHDLWPARTPLFEALLGLAARVLDTRQQATISVIQEALSDPGQIEQFERAMAQLGPNRPDHRFTSELIGSVRERFTGGFFDALRSTAANSVAGSQRRLIELGELKTTGAVVGVSRSGADDHLHVGRITELSSTTVTVEELLVGEPGAAALLTDEGAINARRLGISPRTSQTTLAVGHIHVLSATELDLHLERMLGRLSRDVRLLVPESVSGRGVLQAVQEMRIVASAELVDEVVRTGQRSVVVRIGVRADRSVEAVIETVQAHVASVYRWPDGVSKHVRAGVPRRVAYLGPAGTFSEEAARQLAERLDGSHAPIVDLPGFADVLHAAVGGDIGVIPLTSSASGLVSRAVDALLSEESDIEAGGVIDVAVRFDAYTSPLGAVETIRGATVYSHPQGLAQCRAFIKRLDLSPVETPSTAAALEHVAGATTPAVALAGAGKEEEYGLRVAEREVDDLSGSITRFLVVGARGTFGEPEGGSAPTLRSIWIGKQVADALALLHRSGAGFDELLTDDSGQFLLISSRDATNAPPLHGCRYLGSIPWSPRTPIVRPRVRQ